MDSGLHVGETIVTAPYPGASNGFLMITVAKALYYVDNPGKLRCVVGLDLTLTTIQQNIQEKVRDNISRKGIYHPPVAAVTVAYPKTAFKDVVQQAMSMNAKEIKESLGSDALENALKDSGLNLKESNVEDKVDEVRPLRALVGEAGPEPKPPWARGRVPLVCLVHV